MLKIGTSSSQAIAECFLNHNYFPDDPEFTPVIQQIEDAIEAGVNPERIAQGSSGSYFVKNSQGEYVGIFKPKNEEPYGPRNPKWMKWFQKVCLPCCFGRGCLLMNQGYLSEAGACLIDEMFGLNLVPKTKVVWLAAPTFNYSGLDRTASDERIVRAKESARTFQRFYGIGLPTKAGSLQLFVKNYKSAKTFLSEFNFESASQEIRQEFQQQFERLVVLDYLIRNTDRGSDNWLIKYDDGTQVQEVHDTTLLDANKSFKSQKSVTSFKSAPKPSIRIAAIDNGLAFPFKHPDEWRKCKCATVEWFLSILSEKGGIFSDPFGWTWLTLAKQPFSEDLRELLASKLENINFIEEVCDELKHLFQMDKEFSLITFEKQMSVFRGQVLNLNKALKDRKSPIDLVQMQPMLVVHASGRPSQRKAKSRWSMYKKTDHKREPFFRNF